VAKLLAPFTPFIAEELYQNLVRSVDAAAPESVHLCDWPVADEAAIDAGVSFDMAPRGAWSSWAARRATRPPSRPASRWRGRGGGCRRPSAPPSSAARHRDRRAQRQGAASGRRLRELLAYALKPNLKVLGPRLGKQVGAVGAALKQSTPPFWSPSCAPPARRPSCWPTARAAPGRGRRAGRDRSPPRAARSRATAAFTVALAPHRSGAARRGHRARAGPCRSALAQKRRFTHRRHDQPGAGGAGRAGRARRAQRGVHQERDPGQRARARRRPRSYRETCGSRDTTWSWASAPRARSSRSTTAEQLIRGRIRELSVEVQAAMDIALSDRSVSFSYDIVGLRLERV
jgi:hypothetical protein